mgnify:CR=1 FL=1
MDQKIQKVVIDCDPGIDDSLALMLALTMCAGAVAETENPVAGKKVAYVMLLPSATIFQMWKDSLHQ